MEIIPFMPFSEEEQAVVTHRFFLELNKRIKQPINLNKKVSRYIGHSRIVLSDSKVICSKIAEQDFDREMGARSLKDAVKRNEIEFASAYKNMDGLVKESLNDGPLLKFNLQLRATAADTVLFKVVKQDDVPVVVDQAEVPEPDEAEVEPATRPSSPGAPPEGKKTPGAPKKKRKRLDTPPPTPEMGQTNAPGKKDGVELRPRDDQDRFAKPAGT
jgi:hypothetical protein